MTQKFNCIVADDEPIAREIIESFINKTPSLNLISSFENAIDVIEFSKSNSVDIYFIDINMPELNGIGLAKIIGNKSNIIFTTAYRDYAVEGFNLNIIDYLLKPIAFERFLQAVEKIPQKLISKTSLGENSTNNFLFVRSDRKMIKINIEDIFYIESLNDYLKIHTKEKTIITRETISNLEKKLSQSSFIRTHRSFIIAISKIDSYTNEFVELHKKAIPISRSYKESVLQKLAEL